MQKFLIFVVMLASLLVAALGDTEDRTISIDTSEDKNITLECRIPAHLIQNSIKFWMRTNKKAARDNVALEFTPLDDNYKLNHNVKTGQYDLVVAKVAYERDNGKFECHAKTPNSGTELYSQNYLVTVLREPNKPEISPSPNPTATEGKSFELTCSSSGGSPDPVIRWYREGSSDPIEPVTRYGSRQDLVTSAVLVLNATKDDDGAIFRCMVWNRAMESGKKLEAKITLAVNYYPRVEVGPYNPYKIEKEGSVTLQCNVDAKPRVSKVKWTRNGKLIGTSFSHSIKKITLDDAGQYSCQADNDLGQVGEAVLLLDVQYAPIVNIGYLPPGAKTREIDEGEELVIKCNVTSNPAHDAIEWYHEGRLDPMEKSDTYSVGIADASKAATYACRAVNQLTPSQMPNARIQSYGYAAVSILVRHKPGTAIISPSMPVALEGQSITLTCTAAPLGWPMSEYFWWKNERVTDNGKTLSPLSSIARGFRLNISSVTSGDEGSYQCQARNEMGFGKPGNAYLNVHIAPKIISKLQSHVTKRVGDTDYFLTCAATAKPKPTVIWYKDGEEVSEMLYYIKNEDAQTTTGTVTLQSSLVFAGTNRINGNQIMPEDSGTYTCKFSNDAKDADASMHLRIEHQPIPTDMQDKVAGNIYGGADLVCRMRSYPRPEFSWYIDGNISRIAPNSRYDITTTVNESGGNIFTSTLHINNVTEMDYGGYVCRVMNAIGNASVKVKLQPNGPPDAPKVIHVAETGYNYALVKWKPGFDGGFSDVKFIVSFTKLANGSTDPNCKSSMAIYSEFQEFDCQLDNPCNVTVLEQYQTYEFRVKAYNAKGHSDYSDEFMLATTKVESVPAPQRVLYEGRSQVLTVFSPITCLKLGAVVETLSNTDPDSYWKFFEMAPMQSTGTYVTHRKLDIFNSVAPLPVTIVFASTTSTASPTSSQEAEGSILGKYISSPFSDSSIDKSQAEDYKIRVKFCLAAQMDICGNYELAEFESYVQEATLIPLTPVIGITVISIVIVLAAIVSIIIWKFFRTRQKNYEMEEGVSNSVHPSIIQHPPPPYYPTPGMENKGLEQSIDLDDGTKNVIYGGHAYASYGSDHHHHQNGVNMAYIENSYSNSNNGGSVNSQDSLWQMKMASAASNANCITNDRNHNNHYGGYDPLAHGGYGAVVDYMYTRHTNTASPDYSNRTPSRQDYLSIDKRRRDRLLDSPFHDISGLPNSYMEQHLLGNEEGIKQQPVQHLSVSFDESLESGFSTPNSRTRRIIREIIV